MPLATPNMGPAPSPRGWPNAYATTPKPAAPRKSSPRGWPTVHSTATPSSQLTSNPLQPWNQPGTFGSPTAVGYGGMQHGSPWRGSDLISPGGQAQQQATRDANALLATQLAAYDTAYNRVFGDTELGRARATDQRDRTIGALQTDTENALAQLAGDRYRTVDLGMQGVAADRAYTQAGLDAFNQETANLRADWDKQREFIARAFGIEVAQLDALLGFAGEDRDITNRGLDAQTGFAGERRSLSDRQSQLSYDQNNRQARSDATARGAITSRGFADARSELARQLGLAREGSDLDYRSTLSDIGTRRSQNDLGYRRTVSEVGTRRAGAELGRDKGAQGIDSAVAARGVDQSRFTAGYQKAMTDASIRESSLASMANDFGIRESDLRNRLERGINAAHLDYASTVDALQSALQGSADDRAYAQALIKQLSGV